VGQDLNCFEWQSQSSDHLDGLLEGALKKAAEEHVDSCKDCGERYKHYRLILTSIANQPRSALPVPIRKSPMAGSFLGMDALSSLAALGESVTRKSRWERTPWFIRTSVEGVGIAFIILFVVAMVPRVRTVYEKSIEHRLDAFNLAEVAPEQDQPAAAAIPLSRGKVMAVSAEEPAKGEDFDGENEGGGNTLDDEETDGGKPIKVGKSEIWRFNLKTDSPHEIRTKVVETLTQLNISADTPGLGGKEAPGGIQFDLLVPQAAVPTIKHQLQNLLSHAAKPQSESVNPRVASNEPFTWYKNKSKRPIPAGKARVVIWLSQM
jgi:hypothetical protein